jgi:hypothetical protein
MINTAKSGDIDFKFLLFLIIFLIFNNLILMNFFFFINFNQNYKIKKNSLKLNH